MTDQELHLVTGAIQNLVDAIDQIKHHLECVDKVLKNHKEGFEHAAKGLEARKNEIKTLVEMLARVAVSTSDPTLIEDLNKILGGVSKPKDPVEEPLPPANKWN